MFSSKSKEEEDIPMELKSAKWWSDDWKDHYVHVMIPSDTTRHEKTTVMARVGRINSRTENTTTRHGFFTSTEGIEKLVERFPYFTADQVPTEEFEGEEEEGNGLFDDDGGDETARKEYPFIGSITNSVVSIPRSSNSKSIVNSLFEEGGAIYNVTNVSYSSSGKSGSADGCFSASIVGQQFKETFKQRQEYEKAGCVVEFENNLRKFYSKLLKEWWISSNDESEKLLVKHSTINRKRREGSDRYGPTYTEEKIEALSIVYEPEGKAPIIICTFIKDRSYYG